MTNKYNKKIIPTSENLKDRDEKQIYILVEPFPSMAIKDKVCWSWSLKWNSDGINIDHTFPDDFTYLTSKEAALAAIEYVFNNMI